MAFQPRYEQQILKSTFSYAKDEEIYGQGKSATYIYQVVSGAVRISKKLTSGQRQIGAFYFSGDIFGLEILVSVSLERGSNCRGNSSPSCQAKSASPEGAIKLVNRAQRSQHHRA